MSYYASISKSSFYVSTENTGRVLAKLQRLPYQLQLDPDGNITGIEMSHCPIGNDYPIFQEIAPYVRDKSFILFSGEGQEAWKWIFENGKCRKVVPQIVWGSDMGNQYSNPKKLHWLADVDCNCCSGEVNSWDKRCSRALGYKFIVCESCIAKEYDVTVPELRSTLQDHFGLIPCPGI